MRSKCMPVPCSHRCPLEGAALNLASLAVVPCAAHLCHSQGGPSHLSHGSPFLFLLCTQFWTTSCGPAGLTHQEDKHLQTYPPLPMSVSWKDPNSRPQEM